MYGLESLKEPIRVAIIGIGSMGKGLAYQCRLTQGIRCVALADIRLERAIACAESFGYDYRVVHSLDEMHAAIGRSQLAVCEDGDLLAKCGMADVLIESSGSIAPAGRFAVTALEHRKHLVMMNAEADLIFGPFLMQVAAEHGVVYTATDGDQPGVITRMINDMEFWGFQLVMAGNIKGFLDRYSDPTKIVPEADKRNFDHRMATLYTDGTKVCIEMALLANGLGLRTTVPGMHGPRAGHVREVFELFDFPAIRRSGVPVVDYLLGAEPNGGVFTVGYCDNDYQRSMLSVLKMGDGPFYLYYRFNHLCHVEAMSTVAEAYLRHRSLLQPAHGFRTNVHAYAKRPLRRGERLDGMGGYTCYGLIENVDPDDPRPGLPVCLADDVTLRRDMARDERIRLEDVEVDRHRADFALFAKAVAASRRSKP